MIRAIVRPEKTNSILAELSVSGFPAVTKMDVVGRGKQRGVKVGEIVYAEIPKELLMLVVQDEDKEDVISIISRLAKPGEKGAFGDGKIFVSPVEEAYTISSGSKGL
ncbi:MAG: Nitrogen regulatory protein P-II [Pelotomaculum sp. PtaU1.Bin035]|nr:MAG: Nitrogen regulatory protein P-II [Pelotomaculum sp. PtaU1.Bin035]